jgi:vitamin B12 transporter
MRFSVRVLYFLCTAALSILLSAPSSSVAQTKSTGISGIVTDPQGSVIEDTQVSAESIPPAGPPAHSVSGGDGRFILTLPPGRYRVTIARDSFAPAEQEITIAAGETRELQVRLALEPLSSKVVVTAQALPLDAELSPAPLTILTREQIDQRVATSLPDLLATQPGFSMGRTGPEGGSASLFLDGGNSNYTKVLVDGVPANTPGGLIDFSNFTLDNIDKIEVVHGAESALYGSDAMDGVIQIFTHRGTTRIPEFTAFADGGNFGTGHGGADLSGLLGRFDYSAGVSDLETAGQGQNDAFRNRTLSGNFGWRVSNEDRVDLVLRDNLSDAGIPGQTLLQPPSRYQRNGLHDFTAGASWKFDTTAHWHNDVSVSELYSLQHSFNSAQSFYATDLAAFCPQTNPSAVATAELCDFTFDNRYRYNRMNGRAQTTYLAPRVALTGGYEYEVENGFLSFLGMHARRNNQSGFFDARWQPLQRLTLDAGARAEDNSYYGTRVVPRAGASYALRIAQGAVGDTRLRASYGQGIVEPRFDQSFGDSLCFPGNPALSPEESRTIHAGVEQKLASDRFRFTADYFDSRFHNIISFINTPSTTSCPFGAGTFFNTNLARAHGANLSGEARITRWLIASASYTYDSTRTLSAPTDPLNVNGDPNYLIGSRLLRRPVNSGNITLNANYWRINWNLSGYFTGQRFDYNFPGQVINPGYALINLAATYNVARGFSFYGRIANLADKQYQEVYGYPALGREFRIGVKYTTRHE